MQTLNTHTLQTFTLQLFAHHCLRSGFCNMVHYHRTFLVMPVCKAVSVCHQTQHKITVTPLPGGTFVTICASLVSFCGHTRWPPRVALKPPQAPPHPPHWCLCRPVNNLLLCLGWANPMTHHTAQQPAPPWTPGETWASCFLLNTAHGTVYSCLL